MITTSDIKLLESERMTDSNDGGGRRTSKVIEDGVKGNIFPKVSRVDSVYGRTNLRKIYGGALSASVDTYAGAHGVITDGPDNPKICCAAFTTESEFDTRATARDRVESYMTAGPESRMVLFGRQLAGQQSVVTYQRLDEPLPEMGLVLCLSTEAGSVVTTQQYIRVQSVEWEVRTFTDSDGDFQRCIVTMGIGVPLRTDFSGPENASRLSDAPRATKVRTATVVDAARYYGIQPLAEDALASSLSVKVTSPYTQIVPTTKRETPLSMVKVTAVSHIAPAASTEVTEGGWNIPVATTRYTRRPMVPGTVQISLPGSGFTASDDSVGNITSAVFTGTIDYASGAITRTGGTGIGNGIYSVTYIPGGDVSQPAHNSILDVTTGTRRQTYSFALNPIPAPGSTIIDYMALGKWYRLRDRGDGQIRGDDDAYGVGSIDFTTGGVTLTLGALPDVESSIVTSWGTEAHYKARAGADALPGTTMKQEFSLPDLPIAANSVVISWHHNGVLRIAEDNSAGNISGPGVTGQIDYTSGYGVLYYTDLPDESAGASIDYVQQVPTDVTHPRIRSANVAAANTINLGNSITPGTLTGSIPYTVSGNVIHVTVVDDGTGILRPTGYTYNTFGRGGKFTVDISGVVGTIDYASGILEFTTPVPSSGTTWQPWINDYAAVWVHSAHNFNVYVGQTATIGWQDGAVGYSSVAKNYPVTFSTYPLQVDLTKGVAEFLVQGSVMFSAGGKTYIDRNGSLYTDVAPNGAGVISGTIDYNSGIASLSNWVDGASLDINVLSCLTTYGDFTAYTSYFRTGGAPLSPGSLFVQVSATDGTLISATAGEGGTISGTNITGTVNQDMGVVSLLFGSLVPAAGHESEPWYKPANVVGGMIFKPTLVLPTTLKYSCVVETALPLDADVLGLDPVRLPSDGKVPIFRLSDMVVIHNTQKLTLPNPVVAEATYNAGRTNLSDIWLEDSNKVKVAASQYSYDADLGTVTITAAPNLAAYAQPLKLVHRAEDMAVLSDVQINGQLQLTAPLSRDYPAGTSYVSSAILFGDLYARVENVFDLTTFTNWDATATGAVAQFNDIDFPIEVLNNGALTERWRLNFTSQTGFQIIGENLGVIGTGTTSADCAPANPLTGNPYFIIRHGGFGIGWAAGNQLRFNTVGAAPSTWLLRAVLPGASIEGDEFSYQLRGDIDAA